MLNENEKRQIRNAIQSKIAELKQQLLLAESSSETVELDQTLAGRVSRIDAIQQQKMAESALQRDTKLLQALNFALAETDSPYFGVCEACDDSIPIKRLLIKPESKLCVTCQQTLEQAQQR